MDSAAVTPWYWASSKMEMPLRSELAKWRRASGDFCWAAMCGAFGGEDCAGSGANHGVAHAHDVDARDALANVGVDAFEIVEDGFFPVGPIFFEEQAAILRGVAVGQRPVKSPDGFVDVRADGLVCGVDVAEGWGVEEDGVPGGFGAAGIGEAVEREVGGEPGGVGEVVERLRRESLR